MVHLTSNGSTVSCDNGDWPLTSVTVTITNWDESRSDDKKLSDQQEQTISTLNKKQHGSSSQSENEARFNQFLADCNHLQVPGRLPHATSRLKSAEEMLEAAEVELVLPSPQLLDAGALLHSCFEKGLDKEQVNSSSNLTPCRKARMLRFGNIGVRHVVLFWDSSLFTSSNDARIVSPHKVPDMQCKI